MYTQINKIRIYNNVNHGNYCWAYLWHKGWWSPLSGWEVTCSSSGKLLKPYLPCTSHFMGYYLKIHLEVDEWRFMVEAGHYLLISPNMSIPTFKRKFSSVFSTLIKGNFESIEIKTILWGLLAHYLLTA